MDCRDVQLQLIRGEVTAAAVRRHVAACAECRAFEHAHCRLLAAAACPEPSAELDARVRQAARERAGRTLRSPASGWAWVTAWLAPGSAVQRQGLAAAALLVVGLFVVMALRFGIGPGSGPAGSAADGVLTAGERGTGLGEGDMRSLEAALAVLLGAEGVAPDLDLEAGEGTPGPVRERSRTTSIDQAIFDLGVELLFEQEREAQPGPELAPDGAPTGGLGGGARPLA